MLSSAHPFNLLLDGLRREIILSFPTKKCKKRTRCSVCMMEAPSGVSLPQNICAKKLKNFPIRGFYPAGKCSIMNVIVKESEGDAL